MSFSAHETTLDLLFGPSADAVQEKETVIQPNHMTNHRNHKKNHNQYSHTLTYTHMIIWEIWVKTLQLDKKNIG